MPDSRLRSPTETATGASPNLMAKLLEGFEVFKALKGCWERLDGSFEAQ